MGLGGPGGNGVHTGVVNTNDTKSRYWSPGLGSLGGLLPGGSTVTVSTMGWCSPHVTGPWRRGSRGLLG